VNYFVKPSERAAFFVVQNSWLLIITTERSAMINERKKKAPVFADAFFQSVIQVIFYGQPLLLQILQ